MEDVINTRNDGALVLDADTEAFFKNKPKWYVTTLCICDKCGRAYKASIGHKTENCKPVEENDGKTV